MMDKTLELIVIALLGALCSILANKGIAVFNDGLRPILPEYLEKKIGKKELAATSFVKFWIGYRIWYSSINWSFHYFSA